MLINKKYLAKYSVLPLPSNYNYDEILNYVPIAQKIWLEPILGDAFMEELEYQVKENKVSEENATLFTEGGLYQYLSYATCLEGLPFLWVHISEVGLTRGKSDNSESITQKELTYVEAHLRRQVEFLKDSVLKFLCEHQDSFPIFNPQGKCPCCDSCCDSSGKLNSPNKMFEIYGLQKRCVDLI